MMHRTTTGAVHGAPPRTGRGELYERIAAAAMMMDAVETAARIEGQPAVLVRAADYEAISELAIELIELD